jgi:hypothetical protein
MILASCEMQSINALAVQADKDLYDEFLAFRAMQQQLVQQQQWQGGSGQHQVGSDLRTLTVSGAEPAYSGQSDPVQIPVVPQAAFPAASTSRLPAVPYSYQNQG